MLAEIIRKQSRPQVVESSTRLREALEEVVVREDADAPPNSSTWFRSSGIARLCPRAYALAAQHEVSGKESFGAGVLWAFAVGTAYHTIMQDDLLRSLPDGVFQGWWRDRATGKLHQGTTIHENESLSHLWIPKPTEEWQGTDHEYIELEFSCEEYRITGHCDGILVWPGEEPEVLELKSINEYGFQYVDPAVGGKPKAEHVLQVHAYMWLSDLRRSRIVYMKKGAKNLEDALAEHVIRRDESIVDAIKDSLSRTMIALNGGEMPERLRECSKKSDKRAKYCPMKSQCFAK